MKVLVINGSPHKGNCWTIFELVKEQMQKTAGEQIYFEEVHLLKEDIPMCTGCFTCFMKGENKCPHSEKIQKIAQKIEDSDATIILTPSYSLNVSALTKNFMDHMSYNFHRPRFFTKKMLAISTTAGAGDTFCAKYLRDVFKHWGFNRGYMLHFKLQSAGGYVPSEKVINKCNAVAEEFCKDVLSGKVYSPTLKRVFYYNFWRALSFAGTPEDNYDHYYWKETGLRDRTFSKDVPIGPVKNAFGKFAFGLGKKVVK